MDQPDLATDLCLLSIDKIIYLRNRIGQAVQMIDLEHAQAALGLLDEALRETDVGTMKVWQPGEEPF